MFSVKAEGKEWKRWYRSRKNYFFALLNGSIAAFNILRFLLKHDAWAAH